MTAVVQARPEGLPLAAACRALGLNRSSVYARQQASGLSEEARTERRSRRGCVQPRALTPEERQTVRAVLYSPEYHDQPPAEVHAALLAQGQYLGSLSTFHRILRADAVQGERRLQRPPQHHAIPRLCATAPNQVWTWDIERHEALSDRATVQDRRDSAVAAAGDKLRAARTGERQQGWQAALTKPGLGSTVRCRGSGEQTRKV
jgi:hypothetical protein